MHGEHKEVVREGDEYVCRACRKRWDASEAPPAKCELVVFGASPGALAIPNYSRNIGAYRTHTHKTFVGRYQGFTFVEDKRRR